MYKISTKYKLPFLPRFVKKQCCQSFPNHEASNCIVRVRSLSYVIYLKLKGWVVSSYKTSPYLKHHYSDVLVHSHHHDSHQHKIDVTHICVVLATTKLGSVFWPCNSSTPALLRGKLYNSTPESSDYAARSCTEK